MPINKETIISVFDDKLTLMQWLKTINKALEDAVLTGVEITKKGNATLSFKFTFEDGTYLETNDLVLQQGESVVNAYIQNGHLYLTLSNGTNLDAGNVKPVSNFSINANQHLIVNYGDGTSQDLGAIFSGNVNIDGNFTANSIIENMSGYSYTLRPQENLNVDVVYVGAVKNGNKLTLTFVANLTKINATSSESLVEFNIPSSVGQKLFTTQVGSLNLLDVKECFAYESTSVPIQFSMQLRKISNSTLRLGSNNIVSFELNKTYFTRYEVTFLLSPSLEPSV